MTVRERNMMFALGGVLAATLCVVAFMQLLVKPLGEARRQVEDLQNEVDNKDKEIRAIREGQKRLEKYKALSLPSNQDQAASEYATFLKPLLTNAGLTVDSLPAPPPVNQKATAPGQPKKAQHLVLTFAVRARGDINGLIKALAALRRAPVAHRVKTLTITPAEATGKDNKKLVIQMTIEALIVHNADNFNPYLSQPDMRLVFLESVAALRRAPTGLALGPWVASKEALKAMVAKETLLARNYLDIPRKDPFAGAAPALPFVALADPDVRAHVRLVMTNVSGNEAYLRNFFFHEPEIKVRPKSLGYQTFALRSEDHERVLLKGKALRVDQRELYFQVGEDIYGIHIGQTLKEAMRRPLSATELDQLDLTSLYDEDFANQSMSAAPPKGVFPAAPKDKGLPNFNFKDTKNKTKKKTS